MSGAPVKPPGPPSESRSGSSTRQSPVQHLRLHRAGQVQPVRERPVEFLVREGAHLFHHLYHLWLLGIGSVRQRDSQIGQLPLYQADPLLNAGISLSGTGQAATEPFELESGLAVFRIAHQGNRNFIVYLLDQNGARVGTSLANEIGSFSSSKAIQIPTDGTYLLQVDADGAWTIEVD